MCWSGQASAALAAAGIATTIYAAWKKEPPALWMALGYFSLMELLQAFTYSVINECINPANQVATLLSYLHITFQPFFVNALALYFVPEGVRKKIATPIYVVCFLTAIYMLLMLYPLPWAAHCTTGVCSDRLCSVRGNWHIAWDIPMNRFRPVLYYNLLPLYGGMGTYWFVAFTLPLIYGSWRCALFNYFTGPVLAGHLTNNPHEQPAVWCLLSIGILMLVAKTPLRRWFRVKRWILWPKSWLQA